MAQLQRLVISPQQFHKSWIRLNDEQRHYLGRVLRLQTGDRFIAMDGQGLWSLAELRDSETAQVIEVLNVTTELPLSVTLLVAPAKGNAFEQVVRCTTELGITCLVPVISERTILKPSPQKCMRWRRIATEAAEQSCRQVIPNILDPMSLSAALRWSQQFQQEHAAAQYICVTDAISPSLLGTLVRGQNIILMTGPEGGWTALEEEQATLAGYQPVSLGQRILRAATAPIAALSVVAAHLEQDRLLQLLKEQDRGPGH